MNASLGQLMAPFADASDLKLVRSAQSGQNRAFDRLVRCFAISSSASAESLMPFDSAFDTPEHDVQVAQAGLAALKR